MFTARDLEEMEADLNERVRSEYAKEAKKWENKEEISKYVIKRTIESELLTDIPTPEEMIKEMSLFINEISSLPHHQDGRMELVVSASSSYGDVCEVDENQYRYTYYVIDSESSLPSYIKGRVRENFKYQLMPPKWKRMAKSIDCKYMDLFRNGTLDFDTLQDLVYGDCKV